MSDEGRRRHYGEFYGLRGVDGPEDRPVAWVHGNCQAESLRIQLDSPDLPTVRVPPAHELVADDLPHLARLLARTEVLVSQPVRADYRDLPIGTAQLLAGLPAHARSVVVPVVRFAGLYPYQVLVRPPSDPSLTPPAVPYHDLRTLARAADGPDPQPRLSPDLVHAVAERSRGELRNREKRHATVVVSDLFDRPSFEQLRTVNHPGNPVFTAMAARVRRQLGRPGDGADPGVALLDEIHAPRHLAVVEAFGLTSEPCSSWRVEGAEIDDEEVRETQLRWYADRPDVVDAGVRRHRDQLRDLGLLP